MATPTYDLLATTVVSSSTGTVTFSGLDTLASGYRDLKLVIDAKMTASFYYAYLRFNGNSGTYNYVYASTTGSNSATSSPADNKIQVPGRASYWGSANTNLVSIDIFDFATSNIFTTCLIQYTNPSQALEMMTGVWPNTTPVTSVSFSANVSSWAVGSTFNLYGVAA